MTKSDNELAQSNYLSPLTS